MILYEIDTNKYKDLIMYRLNKELGEDGCWMVDADTDEEYANMITAEQKVRDGDKEVWRLIGKRPNHYLDCEVYAYLAADVMNIRNLQPQKTQQEQKKESVDDMIPQYFNPEG